MLSSALICCRLVEVHQQERQVRRRRHVAVCGAEGHSGGTEAAAAEHLGLHGVGQRPSETVHWIGPRPSRLCSTTFDILSVALQE